jgi:hypothetical protein
MHDSDWAWWLIIPSLALGATLTGYGLTFDCAQADTSCQRNAGAAIWGGVGVASFGSLLGISILQASTPAPAKSGSVASLRLQLTPSSDNGYSPSGAQVQLSGSWP